MILRTSSLTLLLGDDLEFLAVASFERMSTFTRCSLVDSEEDPEEESSDSPRKFPLTESGEAIGDGLRQLRERLQGILDGAEGSLERGLLCRSSLFLRGVLALELFEGTCRLRRHVRSPLISHDLHAGLVAHGLLEDLDDELGVLVGIDGERLPELLLAVAGILAGDDLKRHAEE